MRKVIIAALLGMLVPPVSAATKRFDLRGDTGDLFLFVAAKRAVQKHFKVEFVNSRTIVLRLPGEEVTIAVFHTSDGVSCRVRMGTGSIWAGGKGTPVEVFSDSRAVTGKASKEEKRACKRVAKRYFAAVWQEIYEMRVGVRKVWVDVEEEVLKRDLLLGLQARKMWEVVDDFESADAVLHVSSRIGVYRSPSALVIREGQVGDNTSVVTAEEIGGGISLSHGYVVQLIEKDSFAPLFSSCASDYDCGNLSSSSEHVDRIQKELEYARTKVQ